MNILITCFHQWNRISIVYTQPSRPFSFLRRSRLQWNMAAKTHCNHTAGDCNCVRLWWSSSKCSLISCMNSCCIFDISCISFSFRWFCLQCGRPIVGAIKQRIPDSKVNWSWAWTSAHQMHTQLQRKRKCTVCALHAVQNVLQPRAPNAPRRAFSLDVSEPFLSRIAYGTS